MRTQERLTVTDKHVRQDDAIELRRRIKHTLDTCTDPFVCLSCRNKVNMLINALFALPDTVVELPHDL